AFVPVAHARAGTADAPKIYALVLARYVALAAFGALAAGLFAPEALAVLVPGAYREAARPALLLTFAAVAYGAYYVACLGVQLALKTHYLIITAVLGASAAVMANLLLTPRFGPLGAAWSTMLGNGCLAVTTYLVSQRVHPLPYRGARLSALFALAVGLAVGGHRWIAPGMSAVPLKLGLLAVYLVACAALGVWREGGGISWRARTDPNGGT
ncbi:MAG: polysaccharide biosynthesis C-terminal domain-containing protein, partial [Candidatus Eiseniibacteriota bacterium]